MFTGIIETKGKVLSSKKEMSNIHFEISSDFLGELKVDQSVAHDGVCLTVTEITSTGYSVTAIEETLQKTNLHTWQSGTEVNLERCMLANGRFDGHIVQGHIDQVALCVGIEDKYGSWLLTFEYEEKNGNTTVEKGSICVNGVSLTVLNSFKNKFSVAIIPYTFANTNLGNLKLGQEVNIEFDIIGKYVKRMLNS